MPGGQNALTIAIPSSLSKMEGPVFFYICGLSGHGGKHDGGTTNISLQITYENMMLYVGMQGATSKAFMENIQHMYKIREFGQEGLDR